MPPATRSRQKITVRQLEALEPNQRISDGSLPGFYAEGGAKGAHLKVQCELRIDGARKLVKVALGRWPDVSLDEARAEATRVLAEVRAGRDPRAKAPAPAAGWTVARAFEAYVKNLSKRAGSELTQRDMRLRLGRYLEDWKELPLASLTKELCEARQLKIQADVKARAASKRATGARVANATIRDLSAVWNFAADYTPLPPVNPCRKIVMIGEKREHHEIPVSELSAWWKAVGDLKSPLRRAMHRLGLLAGLRPGNLTAIERAWIDLEAQRISFPGRVMKGRKAFTLPLSKAMAEQVRLALDAGDVLEPGSSYLFPTRGKTGVVQATVVTREKAVALANRTGHALRHTWKTCARNARLPESQIALLMAHRLGGMADTYGSLADQFDRLLADQETVSAWILSRVGAAKPPSE